MLLARSFLYGLDVVQKTLDKLAKEAAPSGVDTAALKVAATALPANLPGLKSLRDSAHHPEDRMRLLDRNKRPIVPQGMVLPPAIHAPGVPIHDSLMMDTYTTVAEDGAQATIDVTKETLDAAVAAVQSAVDAFPWTGPARWEP